MEKFNVFDCSIIELDKHHSNRKGNLTVVENGKTLPFDVKRVYYLYDVPGGENRGGHAEINNEELIVALSGAFDIVVDDGKEKKTFTLNRSYYGLYIPKGLWREMINFSTNSLALEFASTPYDKNDYISKFPNISQVSDVNELTVQGLQAYNYNFYYKENNVKEK